MVKVLIIRQREEAFPLANLLKQRGITSFACPLFKPLFFPLPTADLPKGLIITSKNALRALRHREDLRHIPVYAVGDKTAEFARTLGFSNVLSAGGEARDLLSFIPPNKTLWYLSGAVTKDKTLSLFMRKDLDITRHIVYTIKVRLGFPALLEREFRQHALSHVFLFSAYTTELFIDLLKRAGLQEATARMSCLCLSQDVVEKAKALPWKEVWISPQPTRQAMVDYFDERAPLAPLS